MPLADPVDPTNLVAVTAYFDQHRKALMARAGAHGAGIGRSRRDPAAYSIVLYVKDVPADWPADAHENGIPIEFVRSDGFRPLTP
jgi:hypothetical protein